MKRKGFLAWMTAVIICLSLIAPYSCKKVSAMTILETDVEAASDGCTMLGVYGSYYSQAQEALDRINEIRKEACDAGDVPDPRNTSRMLASGDYVPIKWSKDLESIARIRAMEGGLAYGFMGSGHNRLNGKETFSISYNGVSSCAEDLAYNYGTSMVDGINQWYREKSSWVNQVSGAVTGHYTSMIDPDHTYVGLGDFYTEEASYPNTLAGEFSRSTKNLDQTMQEAQTDVMQKIEVKDSYITGYVLDGNDTIYTDKTTTLTPKAKLENGSNTHKLWVLDSVNYTSSNPSVATVTNAGVVTGLRNGIITVTAKSGGTLLATAVITVKCNHAKELTSETAPTCTATGLKVYSCELCGESIEQEIPKVAHDYIYGDADSDGYRTGVCSVCGDTLKIIPPTAYTIWWRDSASTSEYYYPSFPSSSPVGSTIYCWLKDVDGDSSYRDMVMTSTDESVVSVPEKASANSAFNKLNILGSGITTLTIYPKYNPSLIKKYVVRIGSSGSVDITTADVTLSQTSYEYSGNACTPSVSISYHDTPLTKGTDYTVTYEDNKEIGTATAVITGNGIFAGTIKKNFTITHANHVYGDWQIITVASCTKEGVKRRDCTLCDHYETEGIDKAEHTIVTDEEVPATCTETGLTAGSHCLVCGSIIAAQHVIEAKGHNYVDGKCQNCSDIIYMNMNGLKYTILDKDGDSHVLSVAAQEGQTLNGEVNIPSIVVINGEDYIVTMVEENAFAGQEAITAITIPNTVTEIESGAFSNCSSLESITFCGAAAPVTADDIFTGTDTSAIVIVVPTNAAGYDTLAESTGVTLKKEHVHSMVYNKAVEAKCEQAGNIAYYACDECNRIYSDEFGKNEITLEDTVISATGHNWDTVYTIDVPATDTTTGSKSIHCSNCSATKDQTVIPATGTSGGKVDDGEENSADGKQDGNNENPAGGTSDNDSYPKVGDVFKVKGIQYKVVKSNPEEDEYEVSCIGTASKGIVKLDMPNYVSDDGFDYEVVSVGNKAFSGCKKLKTVFLSDFVTTIGNQAFYGCISLKKITIPGKTKKIGTQAFAKCKMLSLINIKSSLLTDKNVGKQAFTGINKKAVVKVPSKKKTAYKKLLKKKGLSGKNQKVK